MNLKQLDVFSKLELLFQYDLKQYYNLEKKYNIVFSEMKNNNDVIFDIEKDINLNKIRINLEKEKILNILNQSETLAYELISLSKDLKTINNNINNVNDYKEVKMLLDSEQIVLSDIYCLLEELNIYTENLELRILNQKIKLNELEIIILKSLLNQ